MKERLILLVGCFINLFIRNGADLGEKTAQWSGASSVTGSMATKLKQYSDEGNLTELAVQLILNEKKTETGKVTLTEKKIRKYFPKEYNREQIEQVIYELLDNWKKSQ